MSVLSSWAAMDDDQPKEVMAFLLPLLEGDDDGLRVFAAGALSMASLRAEVHRAVPALVRLLRDKSPQVRATAARELATVRQTTSQGISPRDLVAALSPLLRDDAFQVRCAAVNALGSSDAKEAIPLLLESLQDADPRVRESAVYAVYAVGLATRNRDKAVLAALKQLLTAPGSQVRVSDAKTLARVAPEAVWEAVQDQPPAIRAEAASGLATSGSETALPTVRKFLLDQDRDVRAAAVRGLNVSLLECLAADPHPDIRAAVAGALADHKQRWRQAHSREWKDRKSGK